MAVTLTCCGATHSPFYFHFCWQLGAHPWTVIICCSASLCRLCSWDMLQHARRLTHTCTHTQTHTRLLYAFPQLLVFYHFFTVTPLHHSFTPTLPLCRCDRVSGSWPAGKWAGWDSHGAHAHMKATAVRTKTQWSNRKRNKTNNDSVTFHPIKSAFTLETFLDPHVAIFCCSGLLWYYINANC